MKSLKMRAIKCVGALSACLLVLFGCSVSPATAGETPQPSGSITLSVAGSYAANAFDESAAEIVAFDADTKRAFVTNSNSNAIDVLDLSTPSQPSLLFSIDISSYGGGINSVAVKNGIVAAAVEGASTQDLGKLVFFNTAGNFMKWVQVGALPDMVAFSPDGRYVLIANEGEPNDSYDNDPEGSVSVVDILGGVDLAQTYSAGFTAFNGQRDALIASGVRIFGPGATVAQDLEPEYITFSPDSSTAFVVCQENNAMAVVDLATRTVTQILPLGFKDISKSENSLDPSDKDDAIVFRTQTYIYGMYQPDSIKAYSVGGQIYIVTANEGDARDYDGFSEETRLAKLTLDENRFPNTSEVQQDDVWGRLQATTTLGDLGGDGIYQSVYCFGGRSFSIFRYTGAAMELVYDSGDNFERITAAQMPDQFNSDNTENDSFDSRSDAKGPEPEALTIGEVNGNTYAFIGLERMGGVMVYDISNPASPSFVQYINNRNFNVAADSAEAGDLAPEGMAFVPADQSPTGQPLLIVANEVSGTTTTYNIQ